MSMSPAQWQASCTFLKMKADQALKQAYPEFEGGDIAMHLYSEGIDGQPMVSVMRVDGKAEKRIPLVKLPAGALIDFIPVCTDMHDCHKDWEQALRIIDAAFESLGV